MRHWRNRRLSRNRITTMRSRLTSLPRPRSKRPNLELRRPELNLSFTRIISPIDGIAGIAQAQVGNLISTTSSPLTTVSTVDPIKVYFTLVEQEYLRFTKQNLIEAQQGASVARLELE